ncbi:MAG: hypothetical protein HOP27_17985 [Anaerolineales bacterium]|nr:hypothetical protein [Anaerolineales bacterium]
MEKIWQAIKDWWEVAVAFGGAIYSAYDIASQLQTFGVFKPDMLFAVGLLLFLLFGSIAILKAVKKSREKKKPSVPNVPNEQNIGVQSKNQQGGLTAHTINIHATSPQRNENISKEVDLTIVPQEKNLDGNSYIIIGITNDENKAVTCRVEIRGIYNKASENIKREISQYANLFSWSGGSQNGTKEILAGLDGTVNLIVRRTNAYGIYFLFHENPDTNWNKSGIYKLDLVVKGTIGETEFIGKRITINFEYIEKEERDSYGGFFNRGVLKLLEWNVEKIT